ncbi:MAG: calcium/sodium antiporter [Candidatus Thermoplasmatota archaeon]|nr:calcium/sodium antiporter [Candidatus Thermoplasmatota archaeon]
MFSIELAIIAFIFGVGFLYKGSDVLVEGTSKTAAHLGVSSLIISVIVVAFGTSAPEFAISVGAAFQSRADISVGNIIGSCIANLLLVIGISAVIRPLKIQRGIVKREMPILAIITAIFLLFSYVGLLDVYHYIGGILFLVFFIIFLFYFIKCAQNERKQNFDISTKGKPIKNILYIVFGTLGVVSGAWLLIESALAFAQFFGISEIIIALSMVAVGTSLPELVVSAVASYKKESDIAVGNVLGSNVFNILLILGISALLVPLNTIKSIDHVIVLTIITFIMFPIVFSGEKISRIEGVFLLAVYSIFIWYLFFF